MRRFMVVLGTVTAITLANWSSHTTAQDKKAGDKPEEKPTAGEIVMKKTEVAPVPNFEKAFGLPFESLESLGQRLSSARRKTEPLALALIATELSAAEAASGKKAEVTSEAVQKEAAHWAKLRGISPELKAVASLITDAAAVKELKSLADVIETEEADRIEKIKKGIKTKGVHVVVVVNNTSLPFQIIVNGINCGWVAPFSTRPIPTPWARQAFVVSMVAVDQFGDVFTGLDVAGEHLEHRFYLNP